MRYLLDTNIASHIIKGDIPRVRERVAGLPMESIVISTVTEAELRYGVAKRGHPGGLAQRVDEFLIRVEILPWTSEAAEAYGNLRAASEAAGISLSPLDMMIAAHASAVDAILVTRDRVFARLPGNLPIEDWTV